VTDYRGETLLNAAAALGLTALNDGVHPTLVRTNGHSFIDLTFVSQELVGADWRVLHDEESLSDHLFVLSEIEYRSSRVTHINSHKGGRSHLHQEPTEGSRKVLGH